VTTAAEVLEMLWPGLGAEAAASNLHKAASNARGALGERGAIALHGGVVELAPPLATLPAVALVVTSAAL
jgi:hypothetical protein